MHTNTHYTCTHRYRHMFFFFFTFTSRWDVLIACEGNDPSYMQKSDWVIRCEKPLKLPSFFFCPRRPRLPPFLLQPTNLLSSIPGFPTLQELFSSLPWCWVNRSVWVCSLETCGGEFCILCVCVCWRVYAVCVCLLVVQCWLNASKYRGTWFKASCLQSHLHLTAKTPNSLPAHPHASTQTDKYLPYGLIQLQ